MNVLLFDVETTGLKPGKSYIVSNGVLIYNTETGKVSKFYEVLNWKMIFPSFSIPEEVIKIHGISDEIMVNEGIHPLKSMSNFYKFIKDFVADGMVDVFVAFNLPFDLNMYMSNLKYLNEKYSNSMNIVCGENYEDSENIVNLLGMITKGSNYSGDGAKNSLFIDSMIIDQIFHFEFDGEKVRHHLDAVGNRYGLFSDPNAHNAMADTERMFKIFKIQMEEIAEKGLALDETFEARLIKKYDRNQAYWGKSKDQSLDYLAKSMVAVK